MIKFLIKFSVFEKKTTGKGKVLHQKIETTEIFFQFPSNSPTPEFDYSLSKRASFLSAQIVAKGKNAAISAKTKSSSSQRKIFFAGSKSKR